MIRNIRERIPNMVNTVDARSKTCNIFACSYTGIACSDPTRGMDVCIYSVFMLSCEDSCLATGWSPGQGILLTMYDIQISELIKFEWAQAREPNPSKQKKNFPSI
jgi:hypothetical protein